eukprot:GHVS01052432.1.p2 GENE.GHVS01052432.1~~GHVS01052432.1.p2  ORF type:complete len:127 (+),score=19.33 GHVS01052432.1:1037-1417(+)
MYHKRRPAVVASAQSETEQNNHITYTYTYIYNIHMLIYTHTHLFYYPHKHIRHTHIVVTTNKHNSVWWEVVSFVVVVDALVVVVGQQRICECDRVPDSTKSLQNDNKHNNIMRTTRPPLTYLEFRE